MVNARTNPRTLIAAMAALALVAAGCGDDDATVAGTASDPRVIDIDMMDIEFSPDSIDVADGETVKLVFHNKGAIAHDAFVGHEGAQAEHEQEMREMDSMSDDEMSDDEMGDDGDMSGNGHGLHAGLDDEPAITLSAGETGDILFTFQAGDDVLIGCHQPGHYDAGMKVAVNET